MPDQVARVRETGQAWLGATLVGVANLWDREYTTAAGDARTGLTAQLMYGDDSWEIVGPGSVIERDGARWEVLAVEPGVQPARGWVDFRRIS